jgi:hypothetical protein
MKMVYLYPLTDITPEMIAPLVKRIFTKPFHLKDKKLLLTNWCPFPLQTLVDEHGFCVDSPNFTFEAGRESWYRANIWIEPIAFRWQLWLESNQRYCQTDEPDFNLAYETGLVYWDRAKSTVKRCYVLFPGITGDRAGTTPVQSGHITQ